MLYTPRLPPFSLPLYFTYFTYFSTPKVHYSIGNLGQITFQSVTLQCRSLIETLETELISSARYARLIKIRYRVRLFSFFLTYFFYCLPLGRYLRNRDMKMEFN